jgi:Tn3 transposase DDE domain
VYRRKISRQLNKGESLHALRRDLHYAQQGTITRPQGRSVPDEVLAHISPGHSDNVNFFGVINVDVEAELAKLDGGLAPAAGCPAARPRPRLTRQGTTCCSCK